MGPKTENGVAKQESCFFKRHPMASVVIGVIAIVAGMWLWGFLDAASSVKKGMSLWDYNQKKNSMNFISRSGMDFYLENFTDFSSRQRELQDTFDGFRRIFE